MIGPLAIIFLTGDHTNAPHLHQILLPSLKSCKLNACLLRRHLFPLGSPRTVVANLIVFGNTFILFVM